MVIAVIGWLTMTFSMQSSGHPADGATGFAVFAIGGVIAMLGQLGAQHPRRGGDADPIHRTRSLHIAEARDEVRASTQQSALVAPDSIDHGRSTAHSGL
ncbi:hypothetical protein ABZ412_29165 [Nocardia sp. NPDC005746]|uniref:hypothetical protein n=1 Tax=Nocardia sp. NPDC005746 TaxID=3157062 RepID=UPI0033E362AA